MPDYEKARRITYGDGQFIPVCPTCGRYVKADETMKCNFDGELKLEPNATCSKCGRVLMPFEGYL